MRSVNTGKWVGQPRLSLNWQVYFLPSSRFRSVAATQHLGSTEYTNAVRLDEFLPFISPLDCRPRGSIRSTTRANNRITFLRVSAGRGRSLARGDDPMVWIYSLLRLSSGGFKHAFGCCPIELILSVSIIIPFVKDHFIEGVIVQVPELSRWWYSGRESAGSFSGPVFGFCSIEVNKDKHAVPITIIHLLY